MTLSTVSNARRLFQVFSDERVSKREIEGRHDVIVLNFDEVKQSRHILRPTSNINQTFYNIRIIITLKNITTSRWSNAVTILQKYTFT